MINTINARTGSPAVARRARYSTGQIVARRLPRRCLGRLGAGGHDRLAQRQRCRARASITTAALHQDRHASGSGRGAAAVSGQDGLAFHHDNLAQATE